MKPEREDKRLELLNLVLNGQSAQMAQMKAMEERLARFEGRIDGVESGLREVKGQLKDIPTKLEAAHFRGEVLAAVAEVKGRVEEQSKFYQVILAGNMPRKPAA
jgi:DNA-binding FrmR family transcriptional regulator